MGETTFWTNGSLYYVDSFGKGLYRYSFAEDKVYKTEIVGNEIFPDLFVPIAGRLNRFIVGLHNAATIINWDGVSPTATRLGVLFAVTPNTSINGMMVSPKNDIYTGNYDTFRACAAPAKQSVFGYLRCKQLKTFAYDIGASVGMVLIEATNTVYHIDSCTKLLISFKWNPSNGELCMQILFSCFLAAIFSSEFRDICLNRFSR